MELEELKIYRCSCRLTEKGFEEEIFTFDAVEKDKTYTIRRVNKDGEKMLRHKKKSQIGVIDTGMFYNSIERIEFIVYCFEGEIAGWQVKLKENVTRCALKMHESLYKLTSHIN